MLDFSPCMLLRLLLALPEPDFLALLPPWLALARLELLEGLDLSCDEACALLLRLSDWLLLRFGMKVSFRVDMDAGCARPHGRGVGRGGETV
jgi:hypothetical protein